jgi:hypothetical protein
VPLLLQMWGFACAYCVLFRRDQEHEVRQRHALVCTFLWTPKRQLHPCAAGGVCTRAQPHILQFCDPSRVCSIQVCSRQRIPTCAVLSYAT